MRAPGVPSAATARVTGIGVPHLSPVLRVLTIFLACSPGSPVEVTLTALPIPFHEKAWLSRITKQTVGRQLL